MLLVLDLETSGLDPRVHSILEVGAILLGAQDQEIARFQAVCPRSDLDTVEVVVREMHTKNGLWRDCMQSGLPLETIDLHLQDWLEFHGATKGSVVLVGHSIHFDLSFIRAQMPHTSVLISHRVRDIGAISRCLREWGMKLPELAEMPHRAMGDCEIELASYLATKREIDSLVQFRALREALG